MSLTIDELCQSSCYRRRTWHAALARIDHTGVGALCATVFRPGLAPCTSITPRSDVDSRAPYGHGRLAGHGTGHGEPFHQLSSGPEPGHVVRTDLQATPVQILEWVVMRWSVEITFEEARAYLGLETQRQWSDRAIARECALNVVRLQVARGDMFRLQGILRLWVKPGNIREGFRCIRLYLRPFKSSRALMCQHKTQE
jgi:hypothetical protein